jgi:hypothetical protein
MQIEGCRLSDFLTESPFGTFTIESVRMPDYIQRIDPIIVTVYSDNTLTDRVVYEP